MIFSRSKSVITNTDTKPKSSFRKMASNLFSRAKTEQKHVKKVVTVDVGICSQIVGTDKNASKIKSNKKMLKRQGTGGAALKQNVGAMNDQDLKKSFQRVTTSPSLGAEQQQEQTQYGIPTITKVPSESSFQSPQSAPIDDIRPSLTLPNSTSTFGRSSLRSLKSNRSNLSVSFKTDATLRETRKTSIVCDVIEIDSLVKQPTEQQKQEELDAAQKRAEATKRRILAIKMTRFG